MLGGDRDLNSLILIHWSGEVLPKTINNLMKQEKSFILTLTEAISNLSQIKKVTAYRCGSIPMGRLIYRVK